MLIILTGGVTFLNNNYKVTLSRNSSIGGLKGLQLFLICGRVFGMKKYIVIHDPGETDPPKKHEDYAGKIIADYFKSNIVFLRKTSSSSPDFLIIRLNQIWELKSPIGNGKRTMANILREASGQSKNVVIDLSRCKMNNANALSRINNYMNTGNPQIKKLLIIDKSGRVLDFFRDLR